MKGQLLAALGIVISVGSLAPANAVAPLDCGITQHDIANSLRVTNNTKVTITKNRPIQWSTPQGQKGTIQLTSNLASGQSAFASISKNSGPSCTAFYEDGVILVPRHPVPILTPRH